MVDDRASTNLAECFKVFQEKWSIIDEGKEDDDVIIHVSCHIIMLAKLILCVMPHAKLIIYMDDVSCHISKGFQENDGRWSGFNRICNKEVGFQRKIIDGRWPMIGHW
jgi:hypothetical protein